MTTWHEDDVFWEIMAPMMFDEESWKSVPDEIDLIESLLDMRPGASIVDMGCGPGRHSLELSRRGYVVTGIDRTAVYLENARSKSEMEGLVIEFIQEDMRRFLRPDSYDVALMMFTTFSYFEDPKENKKVLVNLFKSLKPGGKLLLDMMGKEVLARIFMERDWQERNGVFYLMERKVTKNWSWMENRWIRIDGQETSEYRVNHWLYSAVELSELFTESGFRGFQFYGNLEGEPYDHKSRRLVAVGYK
jgi:SAM-dependent methyltransferase